MDILDRITLLLGNREQQELTKYLKLNSVAFSEWKSGKSKSYRKYLIEIAEFFNVSIDYLVYGKEKSSSTNLPEDKQRLLDMYDLLDPMEKGEILGELKAMTKNRNVEIKIAAQGGGTNTTASAEAIAEAAAKIEELEKAEKRKNLGL